MPRKRKAKTTKSTGESVWADPSWSVVPGALKRRRGRPSKTETLFKVVAEKVPFEAFSAVSDHLATRHGAPSSND